jgi:hypothetical protein
MKTKPTSHTSVGQWATADEVFTNESGVTALRDATSKRFPYARAVQTFHYFWHTDFCMAVKCDLSSERIISIERIGRKRTCRKTDSPFGSLRGIWRDNIKIFNRKIGYVNLHWG